MIAFLLAAAAAAAGPAAPAVAFDRLIEGRNAVAIAELETAAATDEDPARLINLGIAYARHGDTAKARSLFEAALASRDWVELETSTGAWIDSRTLARRALAMLDEGAFTRGGRLARK